MAAVTVCILPGFLTAAMAVQVGEDISLSLVALGAVIAFFFAVSAVASPLMGAVVQERGWVMGTRSAVVLAAITLAGIGLTTTTPLVLAAWFVPGGIAAALCQPAANLAIARNVPEQRRGLAFGIKHASVPAATLLGGLAVPAVALTVGWEWAYLGAAGLALLVAASVPRRGDGAGADQVAGRRQAQSPATPLYLLVALALGAALGIGGLDALASFLVTYSVDVGFAEGLAGLLLALGSLAGIAARLVAGWMIDRTDRTGLAAIAAMTATSAVAIALIAVGGRPGLLLGGLVAFVAGWGWSGLFTYAVVKDNPEAAAAATGITMTGVFFGAAAGPLLFGFLADGVSFAAAWWATAASQLGAAVIMLFVRHRRAARLAAGRAES